MQYPWYTHLYMVKNVCIDIIDTIRTCRIFQLPTTSTLLNTSSRFPSIGVRTAATVHAVCQNVLETLQPSSWHPTAQCSWRDFGFRNRLVPLVEVKWPQPSWSKMIEAPMNEEWNFEDWKEVSSKEICGSCDGFWWFQFNRDILGTKLDV